jgi:hypothetical protein
MSAPTLPTTTTISHVCAGACVDARGGVCTCSCGGHQHGSRYVDGLHRRWDATEREFDAQGGVMAILGRRGGLAADLDDEPW